MQSPQLTIGRIVVVCWGHAIQRHRNGPGQQAGVHLDRLFPPALSDPAAVRAGVHHLYPLLHLQQLHFLARRRLHLPRKFWTIIIYIIFVALVGTALAFVAPRLGQESTIFIKQVPQTLDKIHRYLDRMALEQPNIAPVIIRIRDSVSLEGMAGIDRDTALNFFLASFNQVTHYFSYLLLSTFFSFLILMDFQDLKTRTMALRDTRLREVYEETADSVVQFALVVGAAFQAQILIACVNTALTAIGLWGLGIHPIALLCFIVFFCGLIPVLGVFISSVPIMLLAFNTGGFPLMGGALVMIIVVHMVEAYVLNPKVFSEVFKINPVLTLMILYIGHRLFGLWGVLLGVPISVYIYRHTIKGKMPAGLRSRKR